jgi:hypothetical protein
MSPRLVRVLYTTALSGAGLLLGFVYAKHQIALSVAYMRAHWGWVCGTGLEVPLYFFPPVGALVGLAIGTFTWRLAFRVLIRNRA